MWCSVMVIACSSLPVCLQRVPWTCSVIYCVYVCPDCGLLQIKMIADGWPLTFLFIPLLEKSRFSDQPQSTRDMHAPLDSSVVFPQLPTTRECPLICQDLEELKLSVAPGIGGGQKEVTNPIKPLINISYLYNIKYFIFIYIYNIWKLSCEVVSIL